MVKNKTLQDDATTLPTEEEGVSINIMAQYIKDLSFENPHILKSLANQKGMPQVDINVQVQANPVGEDLFEVELNIEAKGFHEKEDSFLVSLKYAGLFSIKGLEQEQLRPFILIECPRLLFPFARSIVSSITQEGGMPPLMLSPVDFAALYRQQYETKENQSVN